MSAVHQVVPRFEPGAVGAAIVELRAALRDAGHESEIYADEIDGRWADHGARPAADYSPSAHPDDVIVYHLAIGAAVADRLRSWPQRLVLNHHNITPAELLEPWDPGLGPAIQWGRRQLRDLAPRAVLGVGDSELNRSELEAAGCHRTVVVPVPFRTDALAAPDPARVAELRGSKRGVDWLFVSRIAPNKAQHDIVRAFALHRRLDPGARLWLPGGSSSERYLAALRGLVHALDLDDAVWLPGAVSDAELAARFAAADVFVCLSEHEGFAVPLLEAWSHDLPVVAHAATAVPETAGDAAILLDDKAPAVVAAAVDRVAHDEVLRAALVARGRHRLATAFDPGSVRRRWIAAIESVR